MIPVDKNILIEYSDMKEEIKDLRRRIENNKKELDRLNNTVVMDSVACGKKGKKPIRTVKIQGIPQGSIERKKKVLERNTARLEELELELLELTNQAEEYIETIKEQQEEIDLYRKKIQAMQEALKEKENEKPEITASSEETIRLQTERDTYKTMYEQLLNRLVNGGIA